MIHIVSKSYNYSIEYAKRLNLQSNEFRVIISPTDLPKHPGEKVEVHFVGRYSENKDYGRILKTCNKRHLAVRYPTADEGECL